MHRTAGNDNDASVDNVRLRLYGSNPSVSINNRNVHEVLTATFTATLSHPAAFSTSVSYATQNNTATTADYVAESGSLSFPAGTTTKQITIVSLDDLADEADQKFNVNLSNPNKLTIADSQGIGTILDDDLTITFSPSGPTSGTDASNHSLGYTVTDATGDAFTVDADLLRGTSELPTSSSSKSGSLTVTKADGPGSYRLRVTGTHSPTLADTELLGPILTVTDDDVSPPVIVVKASSGTAIRNGSSRTETAGENQSFSWSVNDLSGSTSTVIITRNAAPIFTRSYTANFALDSFNFNSYGVGSYQITINATDGDNDRANDQRTGGFSHVLNVLNADPFAVAVVLTAPAGRFEGAPVTFSGAGSTDPEGDPLDYIWNFGDGALVRGKTVNHTFADNGVYIVKLTVVDAYGGVAETTSSITVVNVAPSISASTAAWAEWKRVTISLPSATFASRGLAPPSTSVRTASISLSERKDSRL